MSGSALVVRGDARALPLPDASVDLIVTSPPYFALRDYRDSGGSLAGQIGSEPTPAEYIAALVECTREWTRVLKPTGSMFVMLGDKYAGSPSGPQRLDEDGWQRDRSYSETRQRRRGMTPAPKSLMLLPERYRIACVDQLGLIARAVTVWSKPNGLPESVTDRVRRSHEDVVHLTRSPRYFAAVDEIREAHAEPGRSGKRDSGPASMLKGSDGISRDQSWVVSQREYNPLGKLPGSVWTIATEPLPNTPGLGDDGDEHYAAFPTEWPRRLILGWSPSGICTACGEGHRPVSTGENVVRATRSAESQAFEARAAAGGRSGLARDVRWMGERRVTITGYACACPDSTAPTRPAVVLDPFGGTGTTAHVAAALGRIGISVDLSGGYARRYATSPELAAHRRRKVLGLDKPSVQVVSEGQLSFEDASA